MLLKLSSSSYQSPGENDLFSSQTTSFFLKSGAKKIKGWIQPTCSQAHTPTAPFIMPHIQKSGNNNSVSVPRASGNGCFQQQYNSRKSTSTAHSNSNLCKKTHCLVSASVNRKANLPFCYCKLIQPYLNLQATKKVLTLEQVNCLEENKFIRSEKSNLLIIESLIGQSSIKYQKQNFFPEWKISHSLPNRISPSSHNNLKEYLHPPNMLFAQEKPGKQDREVKEKTSIF